MYNYSCWINNIELDDLKHILESFLKESGHGIRGYVEEAFEPQGHTGAYILSESHLAFHINMHQTYIELSSCHFQKFSNFVKLIRSSSLEILKEFEFNKSL